MAVVCYSLRWTTAVYIHLLISLDEMPLKYPLSFKCPRTSTACFIFEVYQVTKTLQPPSWVPWTEVNVSLSCPLASLYSTHTCSLIGRGADQSHLSSCCRDTGGVVAKHRSTTSTSWTIFLKVGIWKIELPHRSAAAGRRDTCSFRGKHPRPAAEPGSQLGRQSLSNPDWCSVALSVWNEAPCC